MLRDKSGIRPNHHDGQTLTSTLSKPLTLVTISLTALTFLPTTACLILSVEIFEETLAKTLAVKSHWPLS